MAITIDYNNRIINVPRNDMTLIQTTPFEVRQLDVNDFRLELKSLEADGSTGIAYVDTHEHNTEVTISGITLARVVQIINGFTVTFEDGSYAVNLTGANNNISDVLNLNNVQLRSSNSAGLISNQFIEQIAFGGGVTIDASSSFSGTVFPTGTRQQPVNNLSDALEICSRRNLATLYVVNNFKFDVSTGAGESIDNFTIIGENPLNSILTFPQGIGGLNLNISSAIVEGELALGTKVKNCFVKDVSINNGTIETSVLLGEIKTFGNSSNDIIKCSDGIQDASFGPSFNLDGSGNSLSIKGYHGVMEFTNKTGPDLVTVDMDSGAVKIDASVVNGTMILRGSGQLRQNDSSTGLTLLNQLQPDITSSLTVNKTVPFIFGV